MISIKKYIESDRQSLLLAAKRAIVTTLEAVSECSLRACPPAASSLPGELRELGAAVQEESSPDQMVGLGQKVERSLRAWGDRADRHLQQQAGDVKEIMLMMARTAESMVDRDDRYGTELNQLTKHLQSIATLHDLSQIRNQLIGSTRQLKACLVKMNTDSLQAIQHLRSQLAVIESRAEKAEQLATTDALTGLPNRRGIEARVELQLSIGRPFCILFFDLNGFKLINDRHGHLAGDELLKAFAQELRSAFRSTDAVGRWGGDEFVAVVAGVPA